MHFNAVFIFYTRPIYLWFRAWTIINLSYCISVGSLVVHILSSSKLYNRGRLDLNFFRQLYLLLTVLITATVLVGCVGFSVDFAWFGSDEQSAKSTRQSQIAVTGLIVPNSPRIHSGMRSTAVGRTRFYFNVVRNQSAISENSSA